MQAGSKWTAMERTFGWRHFRCVQKRGQGKATLVLLQATCDDSTQLWVRSRFACPRCTACLPARLHCTALPCCLPALPRCLAVQ